MKALCIEPIDNSSALFIKLNGFQANSFFFFYTNHVLNISKGFFSIPFYLLTSSGKKY